MGTRSITTIIDNQWAEGKPEKLCTMYRQYDGYPSGHGKELFDFLSQFTIVNGMGLNETRKIANGAGCLAAQMIEHFKEAAGPGGIYMTATRTKLDGEDYGYEVTVTPQLTIEVVVRGYSKVAFKGSLHEFGKFCSKDM
jgi:hypothetical protein